MADYIVGKVFGGVGRLPPEILIFSCFSCETTFARPNLRILRCIGGRERTSGKACNREAPVCLDIHNADSFR